MLSSELNCLTLVSKEACSTVSNALRRSKKIAPINKDSSITLYIISMRFISAVVVGYLRRKPDWSWCSQFSFIRNA